MGPGDMARGDDAIMTRAAEISTAPSPTYPVRPEYWHDTVEDDLIRELVAAAIWAADRVGMGSDEVWRIARKIKETREAR